MMELITGASPMAFLRNLVTQTQSFNNMIEFHHICNQICYFDFCCYLEGPITIFQDVQDVNMQQESPTQLENDNEEMNTENNECIERRLAAYESLKAQAGQFISKEQFKEAIDVIKELQTIRFHSPESVDGKFTKNINPKQILFCHLFSI